MNPRSDPLQELWSRLNIRYFQALLPPIDIEWSARLTSSAGLFVTRHGPRPSRNGEPSQPKGRIIRLSIPLLQTSAPVADDPLLATLAHEMIHQWQFDVLKRRPNHGPDFCRKMSELNQDGLGITIRHRMDGALQALTRYTWTCVQCGRAYERQRRSIHPNRHRCGACHGRLQELGAASPTPTDRSSKGRLLPALRRRLTRLNRGPLFASPAQLLLPFWRPA